jgi:DNA-binding protein H-NS
LSTLQTLLAQKAEIEKQIVETQRHERAEAISKVKSLMSEYGLTASDLSTKGPTATRGTGTRKVAAKYRNASTGETWTGRGLKPKWLSAALADGKSLSDFAI